MAEIVKSEPLPVLYLYSGLLCGWPQMVGDENRRGEGNAARRLEGWKNKIPSLCVRRLSVPCAKMLRESRMQRYIAVRRFSLRFSVCSLCPALGDPYSPFLPQQVRPA